MRRNQLEIHWLGHDGFRLECDELTVYLDPFGVRAGPPAHLILITHEHYDHCDPVSVAALAAEGTLIVAPRACTRRLHEPIRVIAPGETAVVAGVPVEAVPAYNVRRPFHPREAGGVGYLLELAGERIYHAGDTDFIPEMQSLPPVDVALLPVSGTYVMDADEAVEAARAIRPRCAIPMRWGSIVGTRADAERFARRLRGEVPVTILEPAAAATR